MDTLMHMKIAEIVGHQNFAQEGLSKQELDKVNPVIRGESWRRECGALVFIIL